MKLKERRTIVTDVLKYLFSGQIHSPIHIHLASRLPSDKQITKLIRETIKQQRGQVAIDELFEMLREDEIDETEDLPSKRSKKDFDFSDYLNKTVNDSMESALLLATQNQTGGLEELKTELELFATSKGTQRGKHLEFVFKSLLAIPPTSVESERAFLSASYLCNKFRSKLSHQNINNPTKE